MAKKFENAQTTVKGFVIDKTNGMATPFEVTTSYVRSAEKAAKLVNIEELGFNTENSIVVVSEVINKKATPKVYNTSKIYDYAIGHYENENDARAFLESGEGNDEYTIKAIPYYIIAGQIWATNGIDYITVPYSDFTPINATKCDARNILRDAFDREYNDGTDMAFKSIAIHNDTKVQMTIYCVIANDELAKCIKRPEKDEK